MAQTASIQLPRVEFMVKLNVGALASNRALGSRACLHFLKGSDENRAMFLRRGGEAPTGLPILLNRQKKSAGWREVERKKRRGRGIRGKVDERLRRGGEMRLGEGKVGAER